MSLGLSERDAEIVTNVMDHIMVHLFLRVAVYSQQVAATFPRDLGAKPIFLSDELKALRFAFSAFAREQVFGAKVPFFNDSRFTITNTITVPKLLLCARRLRTQDDCN
jgi:hypothetical protein